MKNFTDFDLPQLLADSLHAMEFTTPTPIQAQAIPLALQGKDILGSAQTGTGKTAAFGIPLIDYLLKNPRGTALVLTPTRELAMQVLGVMNKLLGKNSKIGSVLLIGGSSMGAQLRALKSNPRLFVGTPGRINDHLERGTLMLGNAKFLVLDETDRMLDMGFGIQIDDILRHVPKDRQTLMFSATLPRKIISVSQKYLKNPEHISVNPDFEPAANIKQEFKNLSESEKYPTLVQELKDRQGSILVFVKTKRGADQLATKLNKMDLNTKAIHGDLRQNQRERVITAFRNQKYRIIIATDVVARGLDIPHIEHVINYDLPQAPEDYIHRIGRTARAGAIGSSLCLISPQDRGKMSAIKRLLGGDDSGCSMNGSQPRRSGGDSRRGFRGGRRGGSRGGSRGSFRGASRGGSRFEDSRNADSRGFGRGGREDSRSHRDETSSFSPRSQDSRRDAPRSFRTRSESEGSFTRAEPRRFDSRDSRSERHGSTVPRGDSRSFGSRDESYKRVPRSPKKFGQRGDSEPRKRENSSKSFKDKKTQSNKIWEFIKKTKRLAR